MLNASKSPSSGVGRGEIEAKPQDHSVAGCSTGGRYPEGGCRRSPEDIAVLYTHDLIARWLPIETMLRNAGTPVVEVSKDEQTVKAVFGYGNT